ncbi:hypothetical protein EG329_004908 [Mollisiaceae sp. DMI_Dod_QoI]|nr:hypothetical protein EG329_004908 [Helotiales sp. DMI_Dod_QoI]
MEQDTNQTIYDAAQNCSKLFERKLKTTVKASADFVFAEELNGRFHIWAAYVGVFATPKASLDARLASYEDIKDMVFELLDMVQRNLQWELNLTSEAKDQIELDSGSREDGIYGESMPGLVPVGAAIDRLLTLAVAIRRSARRTHKLRDYPHDEQAESSCCLLVRSRFPDARSSLWNLLGASIHTRGMSLQYIQNHNKKLAYQRDNPDDSQNAADDDSNIEDGNERFEGSGQNPTSSGRQSAMAPETLPSLASHSAIMRSMSPRAKPSGSIISRGSTVRHLPGEDFYYPPMPQLEDDKRYQSCTLCSDPLEKVTLTEDTWKAHVDRDLEPYVCISEECSDPLRYFVHMRDWMEHMQTRHTMTWAQKVHTEKWYCDIDHKDFEEFDEKGLLLAHLEANHGHQLTQSKLEGRARRNRRIATRDPFVCPLCDCIPEDIEPHVQHKPYKLLSEHIAQHLKSLAFLSLSYIEDDLNANESIAGSLHTYLNPEDSKISRESLTERRLESFDDIPLTKVSMDTRIIDDQERQEFLDEPAPLSESEDWKFIPMKDLLTDFLFLKEHLGQGETAYYDYAAEKQIGSNWGTSQSSPRRSSEADVTDANESEETIGHQSFATSDKGSMPRLLNVYSHADATAYIVLIHGLGGDMRKTWTTKNGVFWPRDLLPDSPGPLKASIWLYGYNADMSAFTDDNNSGSVNMSQNAKALVKCLTEETNIQNATERPIIWVTHGLGGILLKRALLLSMDLPVENSRSLFISTYGIIFLGTPHTGADPAKWGNLLQLMTQALLKKRPKSVEVLQRDSEVLQNINMHFLDIYQRFKICMVHEGLKTSDGVTQELIVDQTSACPQLPGVVYFGIEASHSEMCKFESKDSPGFRNLSVMIRKWVEECPIIMKKLWIVENIKRAFPESVQNAEHLTERQRSAVNAAINMALDEGICFESIDDVLKHLKDLLSEDSILPSSSEIFDCYLPIISSRKRQSINDEDLNEFDKELLGLLDSETKEGGGGGGGGRSRHRGRDDDDDEHDPGYGL